LWKIRQNVGYIDILIHVPSNIEAKLDAVDHTDDPSNKRISADRLQPRQKLQYQPQMEAIQSGPEESGSLIPGSPRQKQRNRGQGVEEPKAHLFL
jgi:hypothetical protein